MNISDTDKAYWHRYIDFYERAFATLDRVERVLEFGVFRGDSIRWLAGRFPGAALVGCDIVASHPEWPSDPRISYEEVNQDSIDELRALFSRVGGSFDLIIEDGSHQPPHQRNCLVEALPHVRDGGLYIVEDLHTSHPGHDAYKELGRPSLVGPLHLLLAFEHLQATGAPLDDATRTALSTNSLFSADDVAAIWQRLRGVEIYSRATLPLRCYQCGQSNRIDYGALRCACGTTLYGGIDSMSAVLRV